MNAAMLTTNAVPGAAKKISASKLWIVSRSARPMMTAMKTAYFIIVIHNKLIAINLVAPKVDAFSIVLFVRRAPKLLEIIAIKIRNANQKIV